MQIKRAIKSFVSELVPPSKSATEQVLQQVKKLSVTGGWALCDDALLAAANCLSQVEKPRILEFGAGVSTVFFDHLLEGTADIDTFEHQPDFAKIVERKITRRGNVTLHLQCLNKGDENLFNQLFESTDPKCFWNTHASKLHPDEYANTRVPLAFYEMPTLEGKYDLLILDGPNGSGRSIAFPLTQELVRAGSYILIDDVTHYPFLSDCARLWSFDIVAGNINQNEQWIIIKLISKRG